MSPSNGGVMRWSVVCAMVVVHAALGSTVAGTPQKVWVAAGENTTDTLTDSLLDALQYTVSDTNGDLLVNNIAVMNLDVTPDEQVAKDVEAGVQEEFDAVDKTLGEKPDKKTQGKRKNRQMSAIYQGVYVPDARFNAFVDGVMVNMVAEMRRRRMDPLYFRVLDKGVVEHVPVRRRARTDDVIVADDIQREARQEEETGEAVPVGGGVVRGLTRVRRFGNAEVQVAGNSTLIRGHWLCGPLDVVIDYRNHSRTVTRVRTGLQAVQFDSLTIIDRFGAEMDAFRIVSPFFEHMPYSGNRTVVQQQLSEKVVKHVFSNGSFMTSLLRDAFEVASYDKIIPQFGTDSSYYSVLQYLLRHRQKDMLDQKKVQSSSKLSSHFPLPLISH